jgi:hypothetical protein
MEAERAARDAAVAGYEPMVLQIAAILFEADPMGINLGTNTDEYDIEAKSIVARLPEVGSEAEAERVVQEVFIKWFGEDAYGRSDRYKAVADEIWAAWQHS